jgi:uncharacterized protein (DUF2141 family)
LTLSTIASVEWNVRLRITPEISMSHRRALQPTHRLHQVALALLCAAACHELPTQAHAAELIVKVTGIGEAPGQIGCALFKGPTGFPMDNSATQQQWQAADPKGVSCKFSDVADGSYAVSVSYDLNGNKKVDTNFLGIPTEAWGVSNNVRPALRAPRFEEAVFKMVDGKDLTLDIKVAK